MTATETTQSGQICLRTQDQELIQHILLLSLLLLLLECEDKCGISKTAPLYYDTKL